jgi:AcrR family transcriptional regulator
MPPRNYDLGRRRKASEETRVKILEATRALVGGKGDLGDFSMEAVAEKAGVSRMTVYNQFESRTGLLDALADHLAAQAGMYRLREVFGEEDAERAVRKFVEIFIGFWASDRSTLRRMRALGVLFPSLHGGVPGRDAWRLEAASNLMKRHADRLRLSTAAARQEAAELLSAVTGFDVFDALCTDSRPPAQVAHLLSTSALRLIGIRPPSRRKVASAHRPRGSPRAVASA